MPYPFRHWPWERLATLLPALALVLAAPVTGAAVNADAGHLTGLGIRHERGNGVPQDWHEARALYERAIEAGGTEALWRLGRLLVFDRDDPFDEPAAGRRLLERGARAGDHRAAYDLAVMFFHGRGVTRDRGRAADWARQAAAEIPRASMMLANLLAAGDGVERDRAAARRWAENAAAGGIAEAALMLGRMRLLGIGGDRDPAGAVASLEQAHEQGSERATRMLSTALSDGRHLEPDFARARRILEDAAREGDPSAQLTLARWLVTWNPDGPEIEAAWFWVQVAAPYRGRFDSGWDALWHELDDALSDRLAADTRAAIRERAAAWRPGDDDPARD